MKLPPEIRMKLANASILLAALAFCVCFDIPIARFLDLVVVRPLISGFENTYTSAAFMAVLMIAIAFWLGIATTKNFKLNVLVCITIFYATQRWNHYWLFQDFKLLPRLYTWDFFTVILWASLLAELFKVKTETPLLSGLDGFIEEQPVTTELEDNFKRNVVAAKIAELILSTKHERSLAIGIVGEYGSGKTSFMNLITNHFPEDKVELIRFNPWRSEKAEYIGRDFFDLLSHHLHLLNPKLSSLIATYSRRISRVNTNSEKIIQQLNQVVSIKDKIHGEDNQINELLKESGKKIAVLVDDIDRLYSDEIMEVLRLVRNTANFNNICYLVAYERRYVQEAISETNKKAADSYLDKIFQLEIPLPKREADDLLHLLQEKIEPLIYTEDYAALQQNIIPHGFKMQFALSFQNIFRNSRDVIRFINMFQISYQLLKNETLFENLFVLELLKFRFVDAYDLLYERQSDWLKEVARRSKHEEYYQLKEYKQDGQQHLEIEKELAKNYNEQDVALIVALLKNIFNDYNRHKNDPRSIIYLRSFEKYFRFRLASTDLSEKEFQKNWASGLRDTKMFIDEALKNNLLEQITDRLFQVKPGSKAEFEQQIDSLFYLGPKYTTIRGYTAFNDSTLIDKLWNYDNVVANQFYNGDTNSYAGFLKAKFDRAATPFIFENQIIFNLKRTKKEVPINRTELIKRQVRYFDDHVKALGLTDEAMWILYGTREEYEEPAGGDKVYKKWHFEDIIVPVALQAFQENDPLHLLRYAVYFEIRDKKLVMVDAHIFQFFEHLDGLISFVDAHPLISEEIKNDYLVFLNKCKSAGPDKLVEHIFIPSLARVDQFADD